MKLYLLRGCPFAHRASFVLQEKKLAFEPVFFDPSQRPPELVAIGPYAKSPTLVDGDARIWDSQIVMEYLEDRAPEPALMPGAAAARAEVRMLEARAASELGARQGALVVELFLKPEAQRDNAKIDEAKRGALAAMPAWDALLAGKDFLVGGSLSLADVTLYTLCAALARSANVEIPAELANLRRWFDRLAARPSAALLVA